MFLHEYVLGREGVRGVFCHVLLWKKCVGCVIAVGDLMVWVRFLEAVSFFESRLDIAF